MKNLTILRMRPGADVRADAFANLLEHGPAPGTEWLLASRDSNVSVTLAEADADNLTAMAICASYFDVETFQVTEMNEAWIAAIQAAQDERVTA